MRESTSVGSRIHVVNRSCVGTRAASAERARRGRRSRHPGGLALPVVRAFFFSSASLNLRFISSLEEAPSSVLMFASLGHAPERRVDHFLSRRETRSITAPRPRAITTETITATTGPPGTRAATTAPTDAW